MAEIQPFDLGRILQQAEGIKAARAANSLEAAIAPFAVQQSRDAQAIRQGEMQDAGLQRTQNYARLALGVMKDQPAQNWGAALGIVKRLGGDVSAFPEQFDQNAYSAVQALAAGDLSGAQAHMKQVAGSSVTFERDGKLYQGASVMRDGGGIEFVEAPLPVGARIVDRAGMTPQGKAALAVQTAGESARATEEARAAVDRAVAQRGGLSKLQDAEGAFDTLIAGNLDLIYGVGESLYPDYLRSQEGVDLMAERDRFVGLLTMAGRVDLKGQGSVTDGEVKTLQQAQTILSNPNVSPAAARRALSDAMTIFRRNAGLAEYIVSGGSAPARPEQPGSTQRTAQPAGVQSGQFRVRVKQ